MKNETVVENVTVEENSGIDINFVTFLPSMPEDRKGYLVEQTESASKAKKTPYCIKGKKKFDMKCFLQGASQETLFELAEKTKTGELQREYRQAVLVDLGFVKTGRVSAIAAAKAEIAKTQLDNLATMLNNGQIDQDMFILMKSTLLA